VESEEEKKSEFRKRKKNTISLLMMLDDQYVEEDVPIEVNRNRVVLIFVIDFLIQQFFVVVDDIVLDQLTKMLILRK